MDKIITWIKEERGKGVSWESLTLAEKNTEKELEAFLQMVLILNWPSLSVAEWKRIVAEEKRKEEDLNDMIDANGARVISAVNEINEAKVSQSEDSAWQSYKRRLQRKGFSRSSIDMMEDSAEKVLRMLSTDTRELGPVKGLVVGNVQSGKTANMAALITMAADQGWNMFVVLSGMTNNLRIQTIERLLSDLEGSKFNWKHLNMPSARSEHGDRLRDCNFDPNSLQRCLCVSLKQVTRLRQLLDWLNYDRSPRENVKMLIIDDESDQASINVSEKERSRINDLILRLVNNCQARGTEKSEVPLRAVNYIGYTATPYANVLNEAPGVDSLYPANFIATLPVSDEYFGPQQIFGLEGEDAECDVILPGLDIIRTINDTDIATINDMHSGNPRLIPDSMKDAICWFLCGVAYMRLKEYRRPVSMLVHTSSQVAHHKYVAAAIEYWLCNSRTDLIMNRCKSMWERETDKFGTDAFRRAYPDYSAVSGGLIDDQLPPFEEIRGKLLELLEIGVSNILVNDDNHRRYSKGIHLCVDNSDRADDDRIVKRLIYPGEDEMPAEAPAFIVVGGNTLSRGLTIEGLVSTFFLRTSKTADSLMQMGRWFGYRKGYELIPRIWMSELTRQRFEFISLMDHKLREEIKQMADLNISPAEAGPKIMTSPSAKFLQIAAANKIRGARAADYDFAGHTMETGVFSNDSDVLKKNLRKASEFIKSLGVPDRTPDFNPFAKGNHIWRNVPLESVLKFISDYRYSKRLNGFNDRDALTKWLKKSSEAGIYGSWNVILAGRQIGEGSKTWTPAEGVSVGMVNRTRKFQSPDAKTMNIGTLRSFSDFLSDIPVPVDDREKVEEIRSAEHNLTTLNDMRLKDGLGATPQLVIYVIDKDSSPRTAKGSPAKRYPLDAVEDVVGFAVNIPGYSDRRSTVQSVTIALKRNELDEPDIVEE